MFRKKKRESIDAVIKGQSEILELVKSQQKTVDILVKSLTDLQKICLEQVQEEEA